MFFFSFPLLRDRKGMDSEGKEDGGRIGRSKGRGNYNSDILNEKITYYQ